MAMGGKASSRALRVLRKAAALCAVTAVACVGPALADDLAAQRAAAHQLVRGQLPSGLLDYDMDFLAGTGFGSGTTTSEKRAFIARQASAAYGLAKYYEQTRDDAVREPLAKLIEALGELSLPIGKSTTQRLIESTRVLSLPVFRARIRDTLDARGLLYDAGGEGALVSYERGYAAAWGGTTAMALLAELHYFRASGDARFAPLRERWRIGLETLRVPGAGFRDYPDQIEEGPYTNGEAWLAFAVYVDTFPRGAVSLEDMRRIDDHMIQTYSSVFSNAFFHWGAMAASRRFATSRDQRFADFVETQAQKVLETAAPTSAVNNTCPFLEGLAASAATMASAGRRETEFYSTLHARVRAEMDSNNSLQLPPGLDRLAPARDAYLSSPHLADYAGAYLFGRSTAYVRIDMTHHCISAIAEMQRG